MVCLDRCTKIRRLCITSKVDEDVSGLGCGEARLIIDNTPLFGRVGGPNIWKQYVSVHMSHLDIGEPGGVVRHTGYATNHRRSNRRGPTGTDQVRMVWERLTAIGTDATVLTLGIGSVYASEGEQPCIGIGWLSYASLGDTARQTCSTLANVGCLVRIREVSGPLLHRSLTLDTRGGRRGVCLAVA
jgi:hypothetical protein